MLLEKIQLLCKQKGISITALEQKLGISKSSILRWDKASPRIDNVIKVAKFFDVSVDYLLEDKERIHIDNYKSASKERRNLLSARRVDDNDAKQIIEELSTIIKMYGGVDLTNSTKKIPIVSTIKCGNNGLAYEDIDGYVMTDESLHGDLIALRTRGNSMIDAGIDENDLAIIRIQDEVESGEIAAVLIDGEEATLKRVFKLPIGIALEGANPSYKTRYFVGNEVNNVRIIGKLVEVRKRF